ncbi:MAG: hypothetical protein K2Q22_12905 [Cytophagales bacterium]|nr:hypothetical protein [Cytophagales bacterium]
MVLLYVLSEDKNQIEEIAKDLLNQHFVASVNIDWDRDRLFMSNGFLARKKVNLLTGVSKSLLFPKIDNFLRDKYGPAIPEIFTAPIVNMDWDLATTLIENTEKI